MLGYAAYAEKFGWTPQQVDQLTIQQDEWLMPILQAVEEQRAYEEKKHAADQERRAKSAAKVQRGF